MPPTALLLPALPAALMVGVVASRAAVAVPAGERLTQVSWREHLSSAGWRILLAAIAPLVLGVFAMVAAVPPIYWPATAWMLFLAVTLSVIDVLHHRLPDKLTLPGLPVLMVTLLLPAAVEAQWGAWGRALAGAAVMGGLYFLAWFFGAMGYGDVKLAPTIGAVTAWFGWLTLAVALVAALLVGAVVSLLVAVPRMARAERGKRWAAIRGAYAPFGPSMFAGMLIAILWGEQFLYWYTGWVL